MTMFQHPEAFFNTDLYQYIMSASALKSGLSEKIATFNIFYRKAPHGNGWAVVSGVSEATDVINSMGTYPEEYYETFLPGEQFAELRRYLATHKFEGKVWSMREGEIAFPNENIMTIQAPFIQAQILETPLLSIFNHQMNVATKASRVVRSTTRSVAEFGSRRANGIWASEFGGKAAYIAGCTSTSNVLAKMDMNIPCTGTVAHSWIEGHFNPNNIVDSEYEAFCNFIKTYKPFNMPLILLVDTYDPIKGILNAIRAFKDNNVDDNYKGIYGIRLDSGDLVYQSKYARKMMDEHGLTKGLVFATDGLDEYIIPDIESQGACIDCYGVGDAIAGCKGDPLFGGVYKLAEIDGQPCIKKSANPIKIINPGHTQTVRLFDKKTGKAIADVQCLFDLTKDTMFQRILISEEITIFDETFCYKKMTLKENSYTYKVLQVPLALEEVNKGEAVEQARSYFKRALSEFDDCYKRLQNPHRYYVDLSMDLYTLKYNMLKDISEQVENATNTIQE